MDSCYNHKDIHAEKNCIYCGKSYCKACLLLHGERKSIICDGCYQVYRKKFRGSIIRRVFYVVLSLAFAAYYLMGVFDGLNNVENSDGVFNAIIVVPLTFLAIYNFIKVIQMRKWLSVHPYD